MEKKHILAIKYKKALERSYSKGFITAKKYERELNWVDNYINPKKSFNDWLRTCAKEKSKLRKF